MSEQVEGYEDLVDVGGGGFSRVYRARDLKHDRTVAIKILDARGADDSERRAFTRELKAMGGIGDHPHAVTVLESGFTKDDQPYLVMPFFEGGTFADRLKNSGQQPVTDVVDLGIKIASTLETVHQLGYLHRDVKPENIFVGEFNAHALGDFGISSFTDGSTSTRTVGVALTPAHAAPEVWEDEKPTALTDVYSLGSTLYNLLAGRPPFTADSHAALLRKVLSEDPPRLGRNDVPASLTRLINGMLAKKPEDRPASALAVAQALYQIQVTEGYPATPITVKNAASAPTMPGPSADNESSDGSASTEQTPASPAPDDNATVVRQAGSTIKLNEPETDVAPAAAASTPVAARQSEPAIAEQAAPPEEVVSDATEVRSPLQRPVSQAPSTAPETAPDELAEGSKSGSKPLVVGIAILLIAGVAVALFTRGGSDELVTEDPADNAAQDVIADDIGPILIASDPTDLRLEVEGESVIAAWEGETNPNVLYEVMNTSDGEVTETAETELNLSLVQLVNPDDATTCVSVRVTTVEPARVGEWVGPECSGS